MRKSRIDLDQRFFNTGSRKRYCAGWKACVDQEAEFKGLENQGVEDVAYIESGNRA